MSQEILSILCCCGDGGGPGTDYLDCVEVRACLGDTVSFNYELRQAATTDYPAGPDLNRFFSRQISGTLTWNQSTQTWIGPVTCGATERRENGVYPGDVVSVWRICNQTFGPCEGNLFGCPGADCCLGLVTDKTSLTADWTMQAELRCFNGSMSIMFIDDGGLVDIVSTFFVFICPDPAIPNPTVTVVQATKMQALTGLISLNNPWSLGTITSCGVWPALVPFNYSTQVVTNLGPQISNLGCVSQECDGSFTVDLDCAGTNCGDIIDTEDIESVLSIG